MPNIIEITDFQAPELDIYARLSEGQLLNLSLIHIYRYPGLGIRKALEGGRNSGEGI